MKPNSSIDWMLNKNHPLIIYIQKNSENIRRVDTHIQIVDKLFAYIFHCSIKNKVYKKDLKVLNDLVQMLNKDMKIHTFSINDFQ